MQRTSTQHKLKERVKELTCLYDVTSVILQHDNSVNETLTKICAIVRCAYQHAGEAVAELWAEAHYVVSSPIPPSTVYQQSHIYVFGDEWGYIKIHYNAQKYHESDFLEEEQKLLNKVATEVGAFFEKLIVIEKEKLFQRNIAHTDKLAVLGEITAGIAHELNTPLGNILGYAELITNNISDKQVYDDLSKIIRAAIHSREIVKKLMFFSCEMPQHLELVAVKGIIEQSISMLRPNFASKNIVCSFICEHEATLRFDSIQLAQLLFNILLNAIYASPEGSEITVTLYEDLEGVNIEIADQGEGIPDPIKNKIFEPFYTTKPIGKGTGLGLSVVHGIVRGHGGNIKVIDNVPAGIVFRIVLPKFRKNDI